MRISITSWTTAATIYIYIFFLNSLKILLQGKNLLRVDGEDVKGGREKISSNKAPAGAPLFSSASSKDNISKPIISWKGVCSGVRRPSKVLMWKQE